MQQLKPTDFHELYPFILPLPFCSAACIERMCKLWVWPHNWHSLADNVPHHFNSWSHEGSEATLANLSKEFVTAAAQLLFVVRQPGQLSISAAELWNALPVADSPVFLDLVQFNLDAPE